jgi:excisionase family DNA binding protein
MSGCPLPQHAGAVVVLDAIEIALGGSELRIGGWRWLIGDRTRWAEGLHLIPGRAAASLPRAACQGARAVGLFDYFVYFIYEILGLEVHMPSLTPPSTKPTGDANQFRVLRRLVQNESTKLVGKGGESVDIPAPVRMLLAEIARNMEAGKTVSVIAEHHELTTQRAANLLGVSRPFLVRMLEEGKLAFHMVGSHRRVYLSDLLECKDKRDRARHGAIKRLAREDVEAGTYDRVVLPDGAQDE